MRAALDRPQPSLLIFDCDGVLVDSELIDSRVRSECFQAEGFSATVEDLQSHSGISGAGMAAMILERFGRPMPEGFMQATGAEIMRAFTDELRAIDRWRSRIARGIKHAGLRRHEQSPRSSSLFAGGRRTSAVFRSAMLSRHRSPPTVDGTDRTDGSPSSRSL